MTMFIEWHGEQSPRCLHSTIHSSILSFNKMCLLSDCIGFFWILKDSFSKCHCTITREPMLTICYLSIYCIFLVVSCFCILPTLSGRFVAPGYFIKGTSRSSHLDKSLTEDFDPFGQWRAVTNPPWNYYIT